MMFLHRRRPRLPMLFCAFLPLLACAQPAGPLPSSSRSTSMIHASRAAPPRLPPVEIDGVRYEQVLNGRKLGLPRNGGYLAAVEVATGGRRWVLSIYDVPIDPQIESDVQEVYFSRMERVAGRAALLIENERGERFIVDLAGPEVQPAP